MSRFSFRAVKDGKVYDDVIPVLYEGKKYIIKGRAYNGDGHKDYLNSKDICREVLDIFQVHLYLEEVDDLLQSTGKVDCTGKEIYEGDEIQDELYPDDRGIVVHADSGEWMVDDGQGLCPLTSYNLGRCKIIGSKYGAERTGNDG